MGAAALKFNTSLDDSAFERGLARMVGAGANAGKSIARSLASVGTSPFKVLGGVISSLVTGPLAALSAGIAGALAGRAIYNGISNVYDAGAALHEMQVQTGGTLGGLAQLSSAFGQAGLEGDMLAGAINRLQVKIAGGSKAFADLGLDSEQLGKMLPDAQFIAVGHAISAIADPTKKAAAGMAIFGRGGRELLAVFETPAFAGAGGELTGKAKIMAENAETFFQASVALGRAGNVLKGFYVGLAGGLGESVLPTLQGIANLDLTGVGMKLGKAIGKALGGLKGFFQSEDPFQYAILSLKMGLANVAAFFASALGDALDAIGKSLADSGVGGLFGPMVSGLATAMQGAATSSRVFAASMKAAAAASTVARAGIGTGAGNASESAAAEYHPSIFQTKGMQFGTMATSTPYRWRGKDGKLYDYQIDGTAQIPGGGAGIKFGTGMRFQNAFDETSGVNMSAPTGGAHDAGWGTGGLISGAAAMRKGTAPGLLNGGNPAGPKTPEVSAPGVEGKIDGLRAKMDSYWDD